MMDRKQALLRHAAGPTEEPNAFYSVPDHDFYHFLLGAWKRNLEWREFGGTFPHVRTSNTVVLIEEFHRLDSEPSTRYLKWSFGKSLHKNDLRFGYIMKFVSQPRSHDMMLEWQYTGDTCRGQYIDKSAVAVLNFFLRSSTVLATYRVTDENTIAICITEVDNKQQPTIQYGNMFRIDPALYAPKQEPNNNNNKAA
ncbi:SKICH domain-containing protein [Balamuthia mandrillaris]